MASGVSMNKPVELDTSVTAELRALLGERLTVSRGIRDQHGRDESAIPNASPQAVVFPESTAEISEIARICTRHRVPMIPYGVGTSLEGHVLAIHGGVTIDMGRMNRIVAIHANDLDAVVQAGVTRKSLNEAIRHAGLFFPIDPGADATLGGMASTRASGTNAVRYGTMRENVLALTVVLANGEVIRTAGRSRKSAAGYDLTRLFVGSEGTLGIITEVTIRLQAAPEAMSSAVCPFPSIESAVNTVIQTIQAGIPIARSELLCDLTIRAINKYSKTSYPEQPHLFLEFHGSLTGVKEQANAVQEIANANGGSAFSWTTLAEDRNRMWQARHDAYFACLQLYPGSRAITADVCVPISRLAECIIDTQADVAGRPVPTPILGHVGDGNFHCVLLVHPENPEEILEAQKINKRLVKRALAMEGTCTGEHGIGIGKQAYLREELGNAVDVMKNIKTAMDPFSLMNPGKIING
jgi:D-lactate dehydrogenase (cytochrome)